MSPHHQRNGRATLLSVGQFFQTSLLIRQVGRHVVDGEFFGIRLKLGTEDQFIVDNKLH